MQPDKIHIKSKKSNIETTKIDQFCAMNNLTSTMRKYTQCQTFRSALNRKLLAASNAHKALKLKQEPDSSPYITMHKT